MDAADTLDDIVNPMAHHQFADSLEIAIATSKERDLCDDVVLVAGDVNQFRASALRFVLYMFDGHYSSSGFMLV